MVGIIGLVGLLTLDINICGDVVRRGFGGSIYYISRVFNTLGSGFRALTAVGRDFPLKEFFGECGEEPFVVRFYGWDNLVFENVYGVGGRRQSVRNFGYKFLLDDVLGCFCGDRPIILGIVPVLGELLPEDVLVLSKFFDVALDPQGLVRLVRDGGVVGRWVDPRYLASCRLVKISCDEFRYLFRRYDELLSFLGGFSGILVITLGAKGSIMLFGGEAVYIPTVSIEGVVDTTGAGDVYLAGLIHGYATGMGVVESGVLASSLSCALIRYGIVGVNRYTLFTDVISGGVEALSFSKVYELVRGCVVY